MSSTHRAMSGLAGAGAGNPQFGEFSIWLRITRDPVEVEVLVNRFRVKAQG